MYRILLIIALILGLCIGYIDSRPTWDDTGITVFSILAICGFLGLLGPKCPWLWALCVGLWVPFFGILVNRNSNFGSVIALAFAFAGAYAGMIARLVFQKVLAA